MQERPQGSIGTRADALVEYLKGTCNGMPDWVREDPDENSILGHLDDELFCCAQCSWWCELSEGREDPDGGEDICSDCAE